MESEKIIIVLLVIAILFSISSTIINLSLLNMNFNPVNSISGKAVGNFNSQINLIVEGNNELDSGSYSDGRGTK